MAVVVREFLFAADGHTITRMTPGMERDFGALSAGLLAEGLIVEADAEPGQVAPIVTQARPSQGRGRRKDENQPSGDVAGV